LEKEVIPSILKRPSYISVISGEPGTGKTFLSLRVAIDLCKNGRNVVMYSFNEEAETIYKRLSDCFRIGKPENFEVKELVSFRAESISIILSEMLSYITKGFSIIIDSIDSFLSSVESDQERRTFLQSLYRSCKNNQSTLILITESTDPFLMVGYVADAYITLYQELIDGRVYRYAKIHKARDVKIKFPLVPFSLHEGFTEMKEPGDVDEIVDISKGLEGFFKEGGRVIIEADLKIPYSFIHKLRKMISAHHLDMGKGVIYYLSHDEIGEKVVEEIKGFLRDKKMMRNLRIIERELIERNASYEEYWWRFYHERAKVTKQLKEKTGKPPITIFLYWINNLVYSVLKEKYMILLQKKLKFDKEQGLTAIGFAIEGLQVSKLYKEVADHYFHILLRHGRYFVYGVKPHTEIFGLNPVYDKRGVKLDLIPIY
jgi:KaiC/GvpD/RAD55 family RecA-like ATPase